MRLSNVLFGSLMIGAALFAQQPPAQDIDAPDEPGRPVARISVLSGDASVRRSDSGEWVAAALNVPLLAGDSVSVTPGGAVEVQLDQANFARLAGDSEVRISELENGRQQIQLAKGLITWRVLRDSNAQTEISTQFAAVRPGANSSVRVEVAPDGSTRVTVRHGDAEVYSQAGTERIHEGNAMLISGDSDAQMTYASARDQWDNWNDERDNYLLRAQSPRYVSQDIYGAEDLDAYGRWDYDASYGNVWVPNVAANWAPYRDGHWVWEPFYGWTWVDYAPWGWAPFHYGSWYQRAGYGWCWFPGRRYDRVWWRPALVGFVGFGGRGGGVGFGFGNVGWVPLAPYERYRPWYGRGYNSGVGGNRGGFNVNIVNVTNVYRNARFNGAVTGVSASDFERGNFRNRVAVDSSHLQQAGLVRGSMPFNPGSQNMRFSDRPAPATAPRASFSNQRFYSRGQAASAGGSGTQQPTRGTFQQGQSNGSSPRMTTNPTWQRFGTPQTDSARQEAGRTVESGRQFGGRSTQNQPQYAAPAPQQQSQQQTQQPRGQSRGFYSGPQQQQQVPVAPPIVRQREASPSYEQRGGGSFGSPSGYGGGQRGNRGSFSSPAPAPRQAPAPQYRNEPSRPAPASRGESSRPSPGPAPAQRGGGGGGGERGGGQRGGGGGGAEHGRR